MVQLQCCICVYHELLEHVSQEMVVCGSIDLRSFCSTPPSSENMPPKTPVARYKSFTPLDKQLHGWLCPKRTPSLHAFCVLMLTLQVRDEIISSEETYVKELRTLVMVFLRPLEKWAAEGMNGLALPAGGLT